MDIKHFPMPGIAFYTYREKTKRGISTVVESCGDKLGVCKKCRSKSIGGYEFEAVLYTGMNGRWAPTLKALLAKVEADAARRYHLITKFSDPAKQLELIDQVAGRFQFMHMPNSDRQDVLRSNLSYLFAGMARPINCQPGFVSNKGSVFIAELKGRFCPTHPIWLFIKLV